MSIQIDQVLDYLDRQRICQTHNIMESLMEGIHEAYLRNYHPDENRIRELFARMRQIWEPSSPQQFDELFNAVCDLCLETETQAFAHGVRAGMMLMAEVNYLA